MPTVTPTWNPPALTGMQSALISIEPFQVGDEIKLDVYVSYLDPTLTQKNIELELQPQGLWNGLAPLINFLYSGALPGYKINGVGPQPQFDLSRISSGVLPQKGFALAPPPSVDWSYSRRTEVQQDVDAGQLDASGQPLPASQVEPVRPPSYSGPYATTQTQTEADVDAAALAAYVPPPPNPAITSLTPSTALATTGATVTIAGSGFLTGAVVKVGSATITPTTVTATSITVTIPSADVTPAGTYPVSVVNPNADVSNSMNFVST